MDRRRSTPLIAAVALAFAACSHPAPNASPDGAVRAWLEHMEDSADPAEAKEAYELMGPLARENLEARARRRSEAEGKRIQPWEMLAGGRFGLKFRPKAMHVVTTGNTAIVMVSGDDPSSHAKVSCVKEGGGWHVEPELPDVAALPKRGSEGE